MNAPELGIICALLAAVLHARALRKIDKAEGAIRKFKVALEGEPRV
jgi:hypothetical protein